MAAWREGKQRGMDAIHIAYLLQGLSVYVCVCMLKDQSKSPLQQPLQTLGAVAKNDYH